MQEMITRREVSDLIHNICQLDRLVQVFDMPLDIINHNERANAAHRSGFRDKKV